MTNPVDSLLGAISAPAPSLDVGAIASLRSGLQALDDAHAEPAFIDKRQVHDQLAPILAVGIAVQQQVAAYRGQVMAIEMSEGGDEIGTKLEHVHQTLARMETNAAAFLTSGRQLARDFSQLDRYLPQVQESLGSYLDAIAAAEAAPTPEKA